MAAVRRAPLRTVLVGAGAMGVHHARVLAQSEATELVRVVEPRVDVGRAVAAQYGVPWSPELNHLRGVDAVVIAAATEAHTVLARHVLSLGKPLLIEKPASNRLAECEELVATARRSGIPLMCGFVERFNPAVLTVQPLITRPVHISAVRHGPYAPRIRTGVAWDLLIHDVDVCMRLMGGEVADVRAGLGVYHPESQRRAEDVTAAVLTFDDGRIATASASRIVHRKVRSISINEIDRTFEVDLLRRDVTVYRHIAADAATPDGRGYRQQAIIEIVELVSSREPLAAQLDRFVAIVAGAADADAERESIMPAHRVIAHAVADGLRAPQPGAALAGVGSGRTRAHAAVPGPVRTRTANAGSRSGKVKPGNSRTAAATADAAVQPVASITGTRRNRRTMA